MWFFLKKNNWRRPTCSKGTSRRKRKAKKDINGEKGTIVYNIHQKEEEEVLWKGRHLMAGKFDMQSFSLDSKKELGGIQLPSSIRFLFYMVEGTLVWSLL